jgi:hypothetical protein
VKGVVMAKTKVKSFLLSDEEDLELSEYIKQQIKSTGKNVTTTDIIREAIFKYIRNGKPDNKQDTEPDNNPPPNDPFADLKF